MTAKHLFTLFLVALLTGCGSSAYELADTPEAAVYSEQAEQASVSRLAGRSPAATAGSLLALASLSAVQPDRHLIKNAVVTIETDDPEAAAATITNAATNAGGYTGDLNESTDTLGRRTITMNIRVPANRFDEVIVDLNAQGKILHKQITTQDVTEEFVDTEARSRNLKASEERIIEHLGRAGTLDDILSVERELTRVRQQIESLDGRLRFLSDRVAFSTLNITLRETPTVEPLLPAQTYSPGQTFSEATRALAGLAQTFVVVLIWIGVWSPVWIAAALIAFTVRRRINRHATA
jgi:hypothetical protein